MNIQDFTYLLKDPSNINEEKTKQLEIKTLNELTYEKNSTFF